MCNNLHLTWSFERFKIAFFPQLRLAEGKSMTPLLSAWIDCYCRVKSTWELWPCKVKPSCFPAEQTEALVTFKRSERLNLIPVITIQHKPLRHGLNKKKNGKKRQSTAGLCSVQGRKNKTKQKTHTQHYSTSISRDGRRAVAAEKFSLQFWLCVCEN